MQMQNQLLGLLLLCSVIQSAHASVAFSESSASGVEGRIWQYDPAEFRASAWSTRQYEIRVGGAMPAHQKPFFAFDAATSAPDVLSATNNEGLISSNIDGVGFGYGVNQFPRWTSASGSVREVLIDLGAAPIDGTFTLSASVNSSSYIYGDYGSLTREGRTNISYLELRFDPAEVNMFDEVFTLPYGTDIGINTDLTSFMTGYTGLLNRLSALGISIVLNEQYGVCDGVVIDGEDTCGLGVNGLHIYSPLSGEHEVRLGVSYARQMAVSVVSVPEPETYAMMLAGLGLVGWAARRRMG